MYVSIYVRNDIHIYNLHMHIYSNQFCVRHIYIGCFCFRAPGSEKRKHTNKESEIKDKGNSYWDE